MQGKRTPNGLPLAQRIEMRSERVGDCWLWVGSTIKGYGRINVGGSVQLAHRAAYEAFIGPIPEGLHVDHTCFVRACVNPAHLEAVTQAENNRRSYRAGRITVEVAQAAHIAAAKARTRCRRGTHAWIVGQATCPECRNERVRARRAERRAAA